MSGVGIVRQFRRITDDNGAILSECVADPMGGEDSTCVHFSAPGDDSVPLTGDYVAMGDSAGMGAEHAVGYADVETPRLAGPGEKRIYSRSAAGVAAADMWLKADGTARMKGTAINLGATDTPTQPFIKGADAVNALNTMLTALGTFATAVGGATGLAADATTLNTAITTTQAALTASLSTIIKGE